MDSRAKAEGRPVAPYSLKTQDLALQPVILVLQSWYVKLVVALNRFYTRVASVCPVSSRFLRFLPVQNAGAFERQRHGGKFSKTAIQII